MSPPMISRQLSGCKDSGTVLICVPTQAISKGMSAVKMPWVRRHPVLTAIAGLFIFLYIVGLIIGPEKPASTTAQAQRPTAAPVAPTDPNGWLDAKAHEEFQAAERYAASPEGKRDAAARAAAFAENAKFRAQVMCRDAVKQTLKAPSTADFESSLADRIYYKGGDEFTVYTEVDAQNSFGAKLHAGFGCVVHCSDEKTCSVTEIKQME